MSRSPEISGPTRRGLLAATGLIAAGIRLIVGGFDPILNVGELGAGLAAVSRIWSDDVSVKGWKPETRVDDLTGAFNGGVGTVQRVAAVNGYITYIRFQNLGL